MTTIELLGLILGSSLLGCVITKLGDIVLHKVKHKDERKDKKEDDGNAILLKLDGIEKKLDEHITSDARRWADNARTQILRFGGELKRGIRFDNETWSQILETIDRYEAYCKIDHDYQNTKAVANIEYIETRYQECLETNDFL